MPNQKALLDRVKPAIKTALATVLAYGVALSMNWENAHWAAFAVAFCTLSTAGESLNKGLLRLSGTVLGSLAAFTLIALFPQDRWQFLIGFRNRIVVLMDWLWAYVTFRRGARLITMGPMNEGGIRRSTTS